MGNLTENFSIEEFQTDNGEFNMDMRQILLLQAFRSWLGLPVNVSDGCRSQWYDTSAHNILIHEMKESTGNKPITIPATATDIYVNGMDTWELMGEIEGWIDEVLKELGIKIADYFERTIMCEIKPPIITGRGCYPDTNNQCIHLDCGHLSMNPALRAKRKQVTRWVRINGIYTVAQLGETFQQLRTRLEL